MKTIITTLALVATSSTAFAEVTATSEYAVEAKAFALSLDHTASYNGIDVSMGADWGMPLKGALDFTGTDVGLGYSLTGGTYLYGKVNLDDSFDYSETTVGVSFTF